MNTEQVILVNEKDEELGAMDKMQAHRQGILHRAFSIFIFDKTGRMLIQQRSAQKYHGALLWSNACCSHPFLGESIESAGQRRLLEELGITVPLKSVFSFLYKTEVENDLIENEFDHVLTGIYEGELKINPTEVASFCYISMSQLKESIQDYPYKFTYWFRLALPKIEEWWVNQYGDLSKSD
jgi:isopentenyl-diphosphate delta-isomerase